MKKLFNLGKNIFTIILFPFFLLWTLWLAIKMVMTVKRQQKTIKETLGEEASKEFMQIHKDFLKNLDKNLDEIDRKRLEKKL
jgi:hypothetical protein